MDDQFLYVNRPPVRKGFGENLYARLQSSTPVRKTSFSWIMALKFALAVFAVAFLVLALSAPVRAEVWSWIRQVAGLQVWQWPECAGLFALGTVASGHGWLVSVPSRIRSGTGWAVVVGGLVAVAVVVAVGPTRITGTPACSLWCRSTLQSATASSSDQGEKVPKRYASARGVPDSTNSG